MHVLLVEDNDDDAVLATRALSSAGWRVQRARSADEAIALIGRESFDVALLDYKLPDASGLDLLDTLRAADPSLPVVFLTGYGSEAVAMTALSHGAVEYVSKGDDLRARLPEVIHQVAGRRDAATLVREPGRKAPPRADARASVAAPDAGVNTAAAERLVDTLVSGATIGAAVFDPRGHPVAARLPEGIDTDVLGQRVAGLHSDVGSIGRVPALRPTGHVILIQTESGILAVSAAPGPALLALLLDPSTGLLVALKRVLEAVRLAQEGLQG